MLLPSDRFVPLNCCERQYCVFRQVGEAHFSGAILLNNVGDFLLNCCHCDNYLKVVTYDGGLRIMQFEANLW